MDKFIIIVLVLFMCLFIYVLLYNNLEKFNSSVMNKVQPNEQIELYAPFTGSIINSSAPLFFDNITQQNNTSNSFAPMSNDMMSLPNSFAPMSNDMMSLPNSFAPMSNDTMSVPNYSNLNVSNSFIPVSNDTMSVPNYDKLLAPMFTNNSTIISSLYTILTSQPSLLIKKLSIYSLFDVNKIFNINTVELDNYDNLNNNLYATPTDIELPYDNSKGVYDNILISNHI